MKQQIAILIPAHNEARVLEKTLVSVLSVISKEHVYVVNDGSVDATDNIARKYVDNVLTLPKSFGKAFATNQALLYFDLINRYEYLMPIDADTIISQTFLQNALPVLNSDYKKEIACVVGKVTGIHRNWITAYRMWEYEIAQTIHKKAQSIEDAIMICPGCATVFKTSVFENIEIPVGTLTEDMDLTFLIHRNKLGRIVYVGQSKVITQDPLSLHDYSNQLHRWYTGFWQCLIKHNIPWGGQMLDFEVGMVALEGLFNGILVLSFIFLIPIVVSKNPLVLEIPAAVDLFLFLIPTMFYTGIKNKIYTILFYIPHFYLLRFLSSFVFLQSFIKVVLAKDLGMQWHKVLRY